MLDEYRLVMSAEERNIIMRALDFLDHFNRSFGTAHIGKRKVGREMKFTDAELMLLRDPLVGVRTWDGNGALQRLLKAGLLTYRIRKRRVSYTDTWANFERTEAGNAALADVDGQQGR